MDIKITKIIMVIIFSGLIVFGVFHLVRTEIGKNISPVFYDGVTPECYDKAKDNYCKSKNMNLTTKIMQNCGFFGCSSYEAKICKNKLGEEFLDYEKINYDFCEKSPDKALRWLLNIK